MKKNVNKIRLTDEDRGWISADLTLIVRKADAAFEQSGGSTRHWVSECFIPELARAGMGIVRNPATPKDDTTP